MTEFTEQLRKALAIAARTPEQVITLANIDRYAEECHDIARQQPKQGFVFDQYDGSSVGFYVEIEEPGELAEVTTKLKALVAELEPVQIELGTINGRPVFGRVTFHPSGVRPTYFRRHSFF